MRYGLLFAVISLFLQAGCHSGRIRKLQAEAEAIGQEAVPDSRTGVFRVTLEKKRGKSVLLRGELLDPNVRDQLLRITADAGYSPVDSLVVLPDTAVLKKNLALVTVSVANLRKQPSYASEMVSQAVLGTPVKILKREKNWYYIQTPDQYLSWVTSSSIRLLDKEELKDWNSCERLIFTRNYGIVTEEGPGNAILSDLVAGCIVQKNGQTAAHFLVELPDGHTGITAREGWLPFESWEDTVELSGENLVATAVRFLGIPYMWGGTSSRAFDCSGFVKTVYFLQGIILERDASQQYTHGMPVETDSLLTGCEEGDLLFFGRKEPLRIVHVGICLGNSQIIHASGKVGINSMDPNRPDYSEYLHSTFVGVKRMLGNHPQSGFLPVDKHPWY